MPTRIPSEADFLPILPSHPASSANSSPSSPSNNPLSLVYPSPRESTTSILLLFHGLGDSEVPFATFARNLALPGVLAISVRGIAPLPALIAPEGGNAGFHWGDDLRFDESEGALDPDPGFERARAWVMDRLIGEVLVGKCGWELEDVMLFGFGQGGAFALGLASALRAGPRVEEVAGEDTGRMRAGKEFKGVVSVGGGLPASMVPTVSGLGKAQTPVLVCCGRESEMVDEDAVDLLEREFERVKIVRWKRADDGMPRNRDEVLPMMEFFAERLKSGWL
ncbi:Alpha/Beta hydrolase protein [Chaetomium strumarium]|uniref:Alpha/Beta hydrolase protein n=1 Tax=Chaetomium strumarium TaxID=1170767 RepID=A0AAJ0GZG5_9PEZI|nr:Alpha/Beta hydrolase protein [Chaetomium strumarium]